MGSDGVEAATEILVGVDGFARVYIRTGEQAVAWGEVLVPKDKMEAAWRNYLKDSG